MQLHQLLPVPLARRHMAALRFEQAVGAQSLLFAGSANPFGCLNQTRDAALLELRFHFGMSASPAILCRFLKTQAQIYSSTQTRELRSARLSAVLLIGMGRTRCGSQAEFGGPSGSTLTPVSRGGLFR